MRSGAFSAPVALKEGAATAVAVEVVAGREDERRTYALRAYRPRSNNAFLRSLAVQIGSVESPGAAPIAITKRVALNLTGVPQPRRACDLYDAAARAANGVAFHPACDDPAATNLTAADNDPPSFAAAAAISAAVPAAVSAPTTGRLTHPCDGDDSETFSDAMCAENRTAAAANFSAACDAAASADGVLPASGFHHEWFDYLVNVDDGTEFVTLLAEAADPGAQRLVMGASFRNCRALPRSPGCAGRDVADVAAWGWTAGESAGGVTSVASGERSPPLDLAASPGSTGASIAVVAADGESRREYTLRVARENVPPPPDEDAAAVAGVGAFLEALVKASPLGATTDEEVRFALRFAGMDPLHLADASFRREIEALVRDYVVYAAVEPALSVTATAAAAPRAAGACRRRVAGAGDAFAPAGVDVSVVASFADSAANTTARLLGWVDAAAWNDVSSGFAFDAYLRAFGPIVALAVEDDGGGSIKRAQTRSVPAGFAPRRRAHAVALPSAFAGLTRLPLEITPPPPPRADGYGVTVDGAPITLGSTTHVPVPPCAVGPNHCDARRFKTTVEACVGGDEGSRALRTCVPYAFEVTVPGASAFDADDATLRDVVVRYGASLENALSVPVRTRDGGAFRHDAAELFAAVPRAARARLRLGTAQQPAARGAFVNGRAAAFAANASHSAFADISTAALLDAKVMGGVVKIRVFAEDGATHRDVALHTRASGRRARRVAGLAASESSSDPLFALRGGVRLRRGRIAPRRASGFSGFCPPLRRSWSPTRARSPSWREARTSSSPRRRARRRPCTGRWRFRGRARLRGASWWRRRRGTRGPTDARGPTRMVLDNRTFVAQNVSVYAYVAAAVNASLGTAQRRAAGDRGGPRRRRRARRRRHVRRHARGARHGEVPGQPRGVPRVLRDGEAGARRRRARAGRARARRRARAGGGHAGAGATPGSALPGECY